MAPEPELDFERHLNPAQLEAVRSLEGPHLVVAGAGTGKTRTLVARVAWLVSAENSFTTAAVFDLSGGRATY